MIHVLLIALITYSKPYGFEIEILYILENDNYVGYFADIDNNGTIDGVTFFDYTQGADTTLNSDIRDVIVEPKIEGLASYAIKTIEGKDTVVKISEGDDRFYVIALEDSKPTSGDETVYWYYEADNVGIDEYNIVTSTAFGTGKSNTQKMKSKWNSEAYGIKNNRDIWSINMENWFVPSLDEWMVLFDAKMYNLPFQWPFLSAFWHNLQFHDTYWTSSLLSKGSAYYVILQHGFEDLQRYSFAGIKVRLATIF